MTAEVLLYIILAILVFNFFFDNILQWLNNRYSKTPLPKLLQGIYDEEKYQKSLNYQRETNRFGLLTGTLSFVVMLILLVTGIFGQISDELTNYVQHPILHALAFFALLGMASEIFSLPFQYYGTFVIEEKYGFNKTTIRTFILDKFKGYLLGGILGGLLGYLFLYLITEIGEGFWIYFWLVFMAFTLFMNAFYTSVIMPLFNKLTPLEDGDLKQAIEQYCQKVDFPLKKVLVMDGSKRSTKANAFFSGFGKNKKIVLFDTLMENHSNDELLAVLAHEVGHYKKKHIPVNIVLAGLQTLVVLFVLSLFVFNPLLSNALGAESLSIPLNLMAFGFLYSPLSMVTGLLMNLLSRKNEYQADRYAKETFNGEALAEALRKLSAHNLSNLMPHPTYVFFNYSHPPLKQRLEALEA